MEYKCPKCGMLYRSLGTLKKHFKSHMPGFLKAPKMTEKPPDSNFSCDICGKLYKHKTSLLRHSQIHFNDSPVTYTCQGCSNSFYKYSTYYKHRKRCEKFKKFDEKSKVFSEKRWIETTEEYLSIYQHTCQMCEQRFAIREQLDDHVNHCADPFWSPESKDSDSQRAFSHQIKTETKKLEVMERRKRLISAIAKTFGTKRKKKRKYHRKEDILYNKPNRMTKCKRVFPTTAARVRARLVLKRSQRTCAKIGKWKQAKIKQLTQRTLRKLTNCNAVLQGDYRYKCNLCAVSFKTVSAAVSHLKHACLKIKRPLVCTACLKDFSSVSSFRFHQLCQSHKIYHGFYIIRYVTIICKDGLTGSYENNDQDGVEAIDTSVKKLQRSLPSKNKTDIGSHTKILAGNYESKCLCGEIFHDRARLVNHVKSGHGMIVAFQCKCCRQNNIFADFFDLFRHLQAKHNKIIIRRSDFEQKFLMPKPDTDSKKKELRQQSVQNSRYDKKQATSAAIAKQKGISASVSSAFEKSKDQFENRDKVCKSLKSYASVGQKHLVEKRNLKDRKNAAGTRSRMVHTELMEKYQMSSTTLRAKLILKKYKVLSEKKCKTRIRLGKDCPDKTDFAAVAARKKKNLKAKVKCSHQTVFRYRCKLCQKEFTTSYSVVCHLAKVHKKYLVLECSACQKVFSGWVNLKLHQYLHKRPVEISILHTKQITSGLLQRNDLSKMDEETRKIQRGSVVSRCNVCGKTFQRIQTLARHVKTAHNMILGQRCKLCTQRLFFENFKDFSDHIKHIHKKVIISENDFEQMCVIKVDVKGNFPQSGNISNPAIESMQSNQENITGRQKRQIKRKFDSAFEYSYDMATKSRKLDKTSVSTADHSYVAFSEVVIKDNFGHDVKALIKIEPNKPEAENQLVIDKYCCNYCGKDCRTEILLQRHINRLHREELLREKKESSKLKKNTNKKNESKTSYRKSVKKKTKKMPKSKRSVVRTITEEEKRIARKVCRRDVRVAVRDISKLVTSEGNAKVTRLSKNTVLQTQKAKQHKQTKSESGLSKKQSQTQVRMINTDLKYCQYCDYFSARSKDLKRHITKRHKGKAISTLNGKANKKSLKACQQTCVPDKGQTRDAVVQKQSAHSSVKLDDEYKKDHLKKDDDHETNSCSGDSYQSDFNNTDNKEVSEDEFETSGIGIEGKKLNAEKTPCKSNIVKKNREETGFDFCYICAIKDCYEFFKTKKSVLEHKKESHGKSLVYICSVCEKEYSTINSLKVHVNVSHLNRKVVTLKIAETNLCTKEKRAIEILICTICGAVGEQKVLNGHTCQSKKPTYYCPFCSLKEYSTEYEEMRKHFKQEHTGIREASIKVEMSQTTIDRGSPLNRASNRSIERDAQDQSTVTAQGEVEKSSSAEQKTTSGEGIADKVLECHHCWKQFTSESVLNIHLGQCNGLKLQSFVCGLCRNSYPRYAALKKHILTHLEYEFKCPVCNREFQEQSDLERHANTHSEHKPYKCSTCGKGYCDEKACKRHIKEKHPDEFEKQNGNPVIIKIEVNREDGGVNNAGITATDDGVNNEGITAADGGVNNEGITASDTSTEKPVGETGQLIKCVSNKHTRSKAASGTSKMKANVDSYRDRTYWQCKYCEYKSSRSSNMKRHLNSHNDKADTPVQLDKGVFKRSDLMGNKQEGDKEQPTEPIDENLVESTGIGLEANSETEATVERHDGLLAADVNTSTGQESPKGRDTKGDEIDNRVEQDGDLYIPDPGESSEGDSSGASDTETYRKKTIRGAIKKRGNNVGFRTQNPEEVWPDVMFKCIAENCNKFFQHRKRLQAHKKEAHNKSIVFVCIFCQKEYSILRSFKVHISFSHLDRRNVPLRIADTELYTKDKEPAEVIVCTNCGLAREKEQGIEHVCQPRAPTYYCPFCKMKESSSDVEEIRNHIKQAHPQNTEKGEEKGPSQTIIVDGLNPDTVAPEGEMASQNVTDSGQTQEADFEAVVSCYHCSQEFSSHFDRNIHEHVHTGQKLQQYVCGLCGNSYPRCSALKKHIQQHLEYAFKCHLCDRAFQEQPDLDRHVNTHTGHRPYQCDICGNRYCDDKACKRHIKDKHPDVYFERFGEVKRLSVGENQSSCCGKCGLVLTTPQQLRLHMSRYHGHKRRLFTCSICPDKSFCTKQKLDRHMQIHKHDTLLEAQVKSKQLGSLQVEPDPKLKLHEKVSVLVKDPDALKTVYQQLRIHDKYHSSGLLNRCRICSKRFKSVKNLNLHIRRNHISDENKKFRCTECGKGFTLRNSLKNHVRVHTKSRPYCCKLCLKTFKQIGHVKDHLLTHSTKFFNTCRLCGKQFKMNGSIKPHILTHCKLKPFKCPMCTDTFQDVTQLISHFSKYFHDDVNQTKVFRCPVCLDFQTETKHEMLKHFENHSLDNPFKCETCDEAFPKFLSLYYHKSKLKHFVESDFEVSKKYNNPYLSNTPKVEIFDDYDFDELQTMYVYKPDSSEPTIPELEEMLNPEGIHIYGEDDYSYVKQKKKSGPKHLKEVKSSGTQMDVGDFVYKGMNDANVNNMVGDIQYEDDLLSVAQQLTHMANIDNAGYTEVVVADDLQEETGNIIIEPGNTNAVIEPSKNYNTSIVVEPSENYNTNVENNSLVTQTGQVSSGSSFGSSTAWNTDFILKTQSQHDNTYQTFQIQYPKQQSAGAQEETDQIQYHVQESAGVQEVVNQIEYPQQQSAGVQEDISYTDEPTEETVSATNALLQEINMKSILPSSLNVAADKQVPIVKNTQSITAAKPMVKQTYKVVDQSGNELIFCILNETADSNDVYNILQSEANEPATVSQEPESEIQEIIIDSLCGDQDTETGKKNDSVSILTEIQSELNIKTEVTQSELNTNKQVVNIDTTSKNNVLNAPSRNVIEVIESQEQPKQEVETEVQEIFDKECFYMLEESEQMKRNVKKFDDDEEEALNRKPKFMNKKNEDTGNYPCDICGKRFTKPKLRNYHRKVHLPDHERQFQCEQCGRGFNRSRHLETHKLVHSGVKHYGCDICGRKFTQLGHLTTHKISHRKIKPIKCDLCDWTGATMSNLRKHVLQKHETERKWKCDICDRAYVTVGELKRHSVVHLSKKARSEIIAKTSEFPSNIVTQDGDDGDEKDNLPNYICDICGAGYRQKSSLNLHYTKHEMGDDFKCNVCQKGFATYEILREHEKSHKETELPCDRCGKMLKTRASLRYHIKSVHEKVAEVNYKCAKCQKGFHKQTHFLCHVAVCRSKIVEGTKSTS